MQETGPEWQLKSCAERRRCEKRELFLLFSLLARVFVFLNSPPPAPLAHLRGCLKLVTTVPSNRVGLDHSGLVWLAGAGENKFVASRDNNLARGFVQLDFALLLHAKKFNLLEYEIRTAEKSTAQILRPRPAHERRSREKLRRAKRSEVRSGLGVARIHN